MATSAASNTYQSNKAETRNLDARNPETKARLEKDLQRRRWNGSKKKSEQNGDLPENTVWERGGVTLIWRATRVQEDAYKTQLCDLEGGPQKNLIYWKHHCGISWMPDRWTPDTSFILWIYLDECVWLRHQNPTIFIPLETFEMCWHILHNKLKKSTLECFCVFSTSSSVRCSYQNLFSTFTFKTLVKNVISILLLSSLPLLLLLPDTTLLFPALQHPPVARPRNRPNIYMRTAAWSDLNISAFSVTGTTFMTITTILSYIIPCSLSGTSNMYTCF